MDNIARGGSSRPVHSAIAGSTSKTSEHGGPLLRPWPNTDRTTTVLDSFRKKNNCSFANNVANNDDRRIHILRDEQTEIGKKPELKLKNTHNMT